MNKQTIDLLNKSKAEKAKLVKGFENLEMYRKPLHAYMNYCGTLGFSDYMQKEGINPEIFKRVTDFNACGCMGANGEQESMSEFLEKELSILNDLHKQFAEKVYDIQERISNLEMHMVESGKAENKSELLQKLRSTKGNIKTYRKDLEKKIADWKDEYLKRKEKRQSDNRHEKLYANAEDLMIDDAKDKTDITTKPKTKLHNYVERNGEIINIGLGLLVLTTSFIILGMKLSRNN